MKIEINNKQINIPDEDITNYVNTLKISTEEAIQMWLDDEGYTTNAEVEEMTQKAKINKTTKVNAGDKTKRKKVERKPTENPLKEKIIEDIYYFLLNNYENLASNDIKITNKTKIIEFTLQDKHFKLDLVQKREKKA